MMTNGKLSEFGEERVRELCRSNAERVDARNTELRNRVAFALGLGSLGCLLGFVVGFVVSVYFLIVGELTAWFVIEAVAYLVAGLVLNWLGGRVDNPDIRVGD